MFARHVGGEFVTGGIYWGGSNGEFVSIPEEGGRLAGGLEDRYIKAPLPLALIAGSLMGLAFALFLPLSGLLVLAPFLAGRVVSAMAPGKLSAAHMASPGSRPGVSYLESPPTSVAPQGCSRSERSERCHKGTLVEMAREIAEKRWQER